MIKRADRVLVVGNFPPPIHGMAAVNSSLVNHLRALGIEPTVVNTSPSKTTRPLARAQRIAAVGRAFTELWNARDCAVKTLYLSLSGGYGQVYDIAVVGLARLLRFRIVGHHHSYAYLSEVNLLTRMLMRCMGGASQHVVLCDDMLARLRDRYSIGANTIVLSNAIFVSDVPDNIRVRERAEVVGFLANISKEKGILEFLAIARAIGSSELSARFRFEIAGTFTSEAIEVAVRKLISATPNVHYSGPKAGSDKAAFFQRIDVLVFPSKYRNEAEPLTVLEAMANGVPVIASDRGCVSGIVKGGGVVTSDMRDFVQVAMQVLAQWDARPDEYRSTASTARSDFLNLKQRQYSALRCLFTLIDGNADVQTRGAGPG